MDAKKERTDGAASAKNVPVTAKKQVVFMSIWDDGCIPRRTLHYFHMGNKAYMEKTYLKIALAWSLLRDGVIFWI